MHCVAKVNEMDAHIHLFLISKSTGGAGEYMRWLANGLDKNRFKITVACLSSGGQTLAAELGKIPDVKAFHIPMVRYLIEPFSDSIVLARLAWAIWMGDFDIIHSNTSKPGFLGRLAALGTGIPAVYSPHGFAFHVGTRRAVALLYAFFERISARYLTTKILVVADAEFQLARRYNVGTESQFVTVHSGIDLGSYEDPVDIGKIKRSLNVPAESPLVGAVGRLYPPKQPSDLIYAAAIIYKQRPDVHYVWVGDGPLMANAQALVDNFGLQDKFHFAGHRNDVPKIMKSLDCFVLPTLWEAFPLTVLEAMAASIPVVATNVDGVPEAILDKETGILVSPNNPLELADGILELIDNPDLARRFGLSGRQRVEYHFTMQGMIDRLECVYEEINNLR